MAYKDFSSGFDGNTQPQGASHILTITDGQVELPDASFVKDAQITRDGMDLVLKTSDGSVVVEDYFAADQAPNLTAPDGSTLTPQLVESFTKADPQYAENSHMSDASHVGAIQEVSGKATITHADGSVENAAIGTRIFEGDVVETDAAGAVNIVFADQTSFAVSEDARLAIDKYVYDDKTQSGATDFSVLKGVFVFTSGLIGRDDPDDVKIETPAGSIGIRGTIIAGNATTGEITVVEGAIVLHDLRGNEVTLADQYETARFDSSNGIQHMGQLSAADVSTRFSSVAHVSPNLFSSIHDSADDIGTVNTPADAQDAAPDNTQPAVEQPVNQPVEGAAPQQVPMPPQGPTPLGSAPSSGFGDTSGFGAPTLGLAQPQGPGPVNGPMGPGPIAPMRGFMPHVTMDGRPPVTTVDPNAVHNNTTTVATNTAPFHSPQAPIEFFSAVEAQDFRYQFIQDFGDLNFQSGDTLKFQLSAGSIANLNAATSNGAGVGSPDLLVNGAGAGIVNFDDDGNGTVDDAGERHGWSFNTTTGELNLYMYSTFDATLVPVGDSYDINISVQATDLQGATSGFKNYTLSAYNPNANVATVYDGDAQVTSATSASIVIRGDNNNIFATGSNTITFQNDAGINNGSNNTLHLRNVAGNLVTVAEDAYDNTLIGHESDDKFVLATGRVQAYGMQGDDTFVLDYLNGSANLNTDFINGPSGTYIDGGESNFRAGHILNQAPYNLGTHGMPGGRGDTLEIKGAATLDFGILAASNKITGIERLDLQTSAAIQTITLNYNDVLELTDDHTRHTLIINVGHDDIVNLNGMAGMQKKLDNFTLNDGTDSTPVNKQYDVYSDGNVTLLINVQGSGAVNFDGTPVTI